MSNQSKMPTYDLELTYPRNIPEVGLLAGVLERAFRDLDPIVPALDRKSALIWFRSTDEVSDYPDFTFRSICSALKLTTKQIAFIMKKVEEAAIDYDNKSKEKGIKSGARVGELAKEAGDIFCKKKSTILRQRRYSRCDCERRTAELSY